jgi:uncharacterized protein YyaL (SSP411 family)
MTEKIERTLAAVAPRAAQAGRAVPMMLAALSSYHAGMRQVVLVGDPAADDARVLHRAAHQRYLPSALFVPVVPAHQEQLAALLPWIGSMRAIDGRATAYVCQDFACQAPTQSPDELASQLEGK